MDRNIFGKNELDRGYQYLLNDIMTNGKVKESRSGRVKSVFGKQFKIDLKNGFPLLTTKKMFMKGIIHELLWFLQRPCNSHGSMNIHYLIKNGIHIWDSDAYRWFNEWVVEKIASENNKFFFVTVDGDDEMGEKASYIYWVENDLRSNDIHWLMNLPKDKFLDLTLQKVEIVVRKRNGLEKRYRFGDLGPIYGKQWRSFGNNDVVGFDQIQSIIDTLKKDPNNRRMLCLAYNPNVLDEVALPPCHVMMQFYTRELSESERWNLYKKKFEISQFDEYDKTQHHKCYNDAINPYVSNLQKNELKKELDKERIPIYGLSCMWTQRSCDLFLGGAWNIAFYGLLTHMIAKLVGMEPDMLVWSIGDCHIYEAHFDAVKEQLSRQGSDVLPQLEIHGIQTSVNDFNYDDFEIIGYAPDPPIK